MKSSKSFNSRKKRGERVIKYFAVYIGRQKDIKLVPSVGRIIRGRKFEVTLDIYNTLRHDIKNYRVSEKVSYLPVD